MLRSTFAVSLVFGNKRILCVFCPTQSTGGSPMHNVHMTVLHGAHVTMYKELADAIKSGALTWLIERFRSPVWKSVFTFNFVPSSQFCDLDDSEIIVQAQLLYRLGGHDNVDFTAIAHVLAQSISDSVAQLADTQGWVIRVDLPVENATASVVIPGLKAEDFRPLVGTRMAVEARP